LFELADIEIGQHVAVDNDRGDVPLAGEPLHFVGGFRIPTHVNFLKRDAVPVQVVFGVHAPTAERPGVKFHFFHDFFL